MLISLLIVTESIKMPKGQPSGKRINWDENTKGKLCVAILEVSNIESINWPAVVEHSGIDGLTTVAAQ